MKKIYLHIGPHKTGSTYIQKTLFDACDVLESKGVHYPKHLIGPQWGHHKLVEAIKHNDELAIKEMLNQLPECSFISSENFENLTQENIDYFFSFLADFNVNLIFVKRSFSELIVSNWQESIKHGSDTPWSSFVLEHILKPYSSIILNQSGTISKWKAHCNSIDVIDYDTLKEEGIDIVDYILESIFKIKSINVSTGRSVNASMNYSDIELIRILNSLYKDNVGHPGAKIREAYLKLKQKNNEYINEIIHLISENLVEFSPSKAWGIAYFENDFKVKYQNKIEVKEHRNKVYSLPEPSMKYIFSNSNDITKLYDLLVIDI